MPHVLLTRTRCLQLQKEMKQRQCRYADTVREQLRDKRRSQSTRPSDSASVASAKVDDVGRSQTASPSVAMGLIQEEEVGSLFFTFLDALPSLLCCWGGALTSAHLAPTPTPRYAPKHTAGFLCIASSRWGTPSTGH